MAAPSKGCVRFAPEEGERANSPSAPAAPAPAAAAAAHQLEVKLGFLPQGGIYATDLLQLALVAPQEAAPATAAAAVAAAAGQAPPPPLPQPEVRGLRAPNLSVGTEGAPGSPHARVVLRLWADPEGPFDSTFTLALPPHGQEVEVRVLATVLSRKKGKPALRPHVRCVGQAADTDTEAASDWAGF